MTPERKRKLLVQLVESAKAAQRLANKLAAVRIQIDAGASEAAVDRMLDEADHLVNGLAADSRAGWEKSK